VTIPRVVEAGVAALVASIVAALIGWRIHGDPFLLGAAAFLVVFLGTLWRGRTSTIHHRSNRPRTRSRTPRS
jgi:hypothetical protein